MEVLIIYFPIEFHPKLLIFLLFLNVFSNAFQQASQPYWGLTNATNGDNQVGTTLGSLVGPNPLYDETYANSNELLQWMIDEGQTSTESSLLTLESTG